MSASPRRLLLLRDFGVTVHESDGCYSRGNGYTSNYTGLIIHHTGSGYGRDYKTLYDGRPDLAGPLCNTSGNEDGSVTLIAAHPANHAGASGGWDTAPLPVTNLFNKLVWGHEIVYPGISPMRPAQYRTATILARVVTELLGVPMSHVKTHDGTSITGKWDPGFAAGPTPQAEGKTIDIAAFRRDAQTVEEDDVSAEEVWSHPIVTRSGVKRAADILTQITFLERDLRADLAIKGGQISVLSAAVAGLTDALAATQGVGGLTADQITEAVKAAVPERLGDVFDRET